MNKLLYLILHRDYEQIAEKAFFLSQDYQVQKNQINNPIVYWSIFSKRMGQSCLGKIRGKNFIIAIKV
jgi:hypothetical protein